MDYTAMHSDSCFSDQFYAAYYEANQEQQQPTPSTNSSIHSNRSENFFFANVLPDVNLDRFEEPLTPTTLQRNLCLDATSDINTNLTDDEDHDDESPEARTQRKLCLCAAAKESGDSQEAAQRPGTKILAQTAPPIPEPPALPLKTSAITDEYRISHEIIGIGESGKVMACFSKRDGTKYALKVLRDGPKSRREVQLHYMTNHHENIVTIADIFENTFDGVKCLLVVIEFLEAGDLLSIFENQQSQPYAEETVAEIVRQIGSAVQYLHSLNIAHRDIKLENILCTSVDHEKCVYKLADFGFAKRPERNHLMESPCCTPIYVAPEVLGHELYDNSCDMWSIGVVTYILLSGYPPFYSMKGLPLSPGMKTRITTGLYAFPPAEWDFVSDEAKNVIRNLLKTDPTSRMTIQQLMDSPFIQRKYSEPPLSADSGISELESEPETPEVLLTIPREIRKTAAKIATHALSARQLPRFVRPKHPRLHSITEEVGRALDSMRLNDQAYQVKPLTLSGNSLYERRAKRNSIQKLKSVEKMEADGKM